ncbi:hypothetical protein NDU88_003750 [Pleurodeles waltl]|uniref:Uncharacterized protein n=1 Tax=Pleurodeles waltl TaxID=8319 RepID=A0AAV7VF28_PLEWA|nr:hypothetical protein NDU88_003750 [Pleurodeles waltl]
MRAEPGNCSCPCAALPPRPSLTTSCGSSSGSPRLGVLLVGGWVLVVCPGALCAATAGWEGMCARRAPGSGSALPVWSRSLNFTIAVTPHALLAPSAKCLLSQASGVSTCGLVPA